MYGDEIKIPLTSRPKKHTLKRSFDELHCRKDTREKQYKRHCYIVCVVGNTFSRHVDFCEVIVFDEYQKLLCYVPHQYFSSKPLCIIVQRSAVQQIDFLVRQIFGSMSIKCTRARNNTRISLNDVQNAFSTTLGNQQYIIQSANQAGLCELRSVRPNQTKAPLKYPPNYIENEFSLDASIYHKTVNYDACAYTSGVLEYFAKELLHLCCKRTLHNSNYTFELPYVLNIGGEVVTNAVKDCCILKNIMKSVNDFGFYTR
ncbi:hypothetical protein AKO1_014815, partial [Acrasis kona]